MKSSSTARRRWTSALRIALSVTVVVVIFFVVMPRIADFSEVQATLVKMTWLEAVTLTLAAAWNLVTYWILMMTTLPGLGFTQAMVVTETSTALANILPGGQALGLGLSYSMFSSWGFRRPTIAASIVVSGIADLFVKLSAPVIALVILAIGGEANATLVAASVVGAALLGAAIAFLAVALKSARSAHSVGEGLGS
ncbi:MAG TPA: hypothetical protein VE889_07315, partial [Actinomycetota bacterium]|nr:hypothetical protein [Actinomycetota bacterium]